MPTKATALRHSYPIPPVKQQLSSNAMRVLVEGKILGPNETPEEMIERVVQTILREDKKYFTHPRSITKFGDEIGSMLTDKKIVFSTPIMTNAGRYKDKPLSACTVPITSLTNPKTQHKLIDEIISLHEKGMGTGFNLDNSQDPVSTLSFLNDVALISARSGKENRPVGNMAIISVYHPEIRSFISSKVAAVNSDKEWKFNISVDIDSHFMRAVEANEAIRLRDGRSVGSNQLLHEICESARICADPGIIFLDRMNDRNPLPGWGKYKTTAPCAEVGLTEGETCQFGYINIGAFVSLGVNPQIDIDAISDATKIMVRALDDCIDVSIRQANSLQSKQIMRDKRKIGVGICGVADAITLMGMNYDSEEARKVIKDILALINYTSKIESSKLSRQRNPCGAMYSASGNRHYHDMPHISELYGKLDSSYITRKDWRELAHHIKKTGELRNSSTIALPPTGRSALIIDASTGVEPHFSVNSSNSRVANTIKDVDIASNVHVNGHISMAAELQQFTDESISKTINMPAGSLVADIKRAYINCYKKGLSGITVYVDGSHKMQPVALK